MAQVDHCIELLLARFMWPSENPLLGKARDDIKKGYYCFPEGRHLIFYTSGECAIDIIGILH